MPPIAVLIVDDSVTIRAVMEEMLVHAPDFAVPSIASNAEEARVMMRTRFHGVVVLDLAMPGTDGLQFLDELAHRRRMPVVVVSSTTTSGSDAEAGVLAHGAVACFDKANILSDAAGFLRTLRKASTSKPIISR